MLVFLTAIKHQQRHSTQHENNYNLRSSNDVDKTRQY